jgi:hypothetical protein
MVRRLLQITLLGFTALMLVFALTRAPDASASIAYQSPYTFEQTFGSALRLLRVDLGYKILERDKELGYILFEYTSPESDKKIHQGSMEIVEGRDATSVAVQIPAMPQYHERMLVDALAKKLESEHGQPPRKKKPQPDEGEDDDEPEDGEKKPEDGAEKKPEDGAEKKPKPDAG